MNFERTVIIESVKLIIDAGRPVLDIPTPNGDVDVPTTTVCGDVPMTTVSGFSMMEPMGS